MHQMPINQSKVDDLIKQCKHFNVFAIDLPAYYYDNEKKPNAIVKLMAELIAECVQYLMVMTVDEIQSLINSIPPGARMLVGYDKEVESDFPFERIAISYLVVAVQNGYLSFKQVISSDISDSKILQEYPEIQGKLDGDNLLMLDENFKLSPYGIEYKDHVFHIINFCVEGISRILILIFWGDLSNIFFNPIG